MKDKRKLKTMEQSEGKLLLRSLDDLSRTPEQTEALKDEWSTGALELETSKGLDRRKFLGLMSASVAAASLSITGCVRKPKEYILPFRQRPEDLIPGNPLYYATSAFIGGKVAGLLVESQEGRPTKIEGNPRHPMSNPNKLAYGASDALSQAEVMHLYDPDRTRYPQKGKKKVHWKTAWKELGSHFSTLSGSLAVLVDATPSPTLDRMLTALKGKVANTTVYRYDPADRENERAGLKLVGAENFQLLHTLDRADVILALDSDLLATEGDSIRNARLFAKTRVPGVRKAARLSRLYSVEARFSNTGLTADNRLRLPSSYCGGFLKAVYEALNGKPVDSWAASAAKGSGQTAATLKKWAIEVAADLKSSRGKSLVAVGERQPAVVHALALKINNELSNIGVDKPLTLVENPRLKSESISKLATELKANKVDTLLILGGNPAYNAPADLGLGKLIKNAKTSIHLSMYLDETSSLTTWHIPQSHFLESWGDLVATDGTPSITQPLIAPLYWTVSAIELLDRISGGSGAGHGLVRETWKAFGGANFKKQWLSWLHDGIVQRPAPTSTPSWTWTGLQSALDSMKVPTFAGLEVNFILDPTLLDGRYANIAWLQELPDPITKLTWDNAALLNQKTADQQKVKSGDRVTLKLDGRTLNIPVWITPGLAENTIVIPLGYGRRKGSRLFAEDFYGGGFDSFKLRGSKSLHFGLGGQLTRTGEKYTLVSTQNHGTLVEPITGKFRPVARDFDLNYFRSDKFPKTWKNFDLLHGKQIRSLWVEPNRRDGHQWAMTIDLNACIGCNACTIACQAENNIPTVGKKEVDNGREMHWIRIDRYFTAVKYEKGRAGYDKKKLLEDPQIIIQPLPCQHCETAPCENVCPVGATLHSPDGLNDIAYNRCVGTRYCANNCPYKVRRFNFLHYTQTDDKDTPLIRLQRNPDVTVRFRGVVEKCSFCVQRITEARIAAKIDKKMNGVIKDGAVVSACEQACPSNAIIFGNLNDSKSRVAKNRKDERHYELLADLNTHPRTTYLAKLRNPNPKLVV